MSAIEMNILDQFSLKGKVAIIAGGKGLYGRQVVEAVAQAGAKTYIASRSLEELEVIATEHRNKGYDVFAMYLDLGDEGSIINLKEEVLKREADILERMPEVVVFGQIPPTKVLLYGRVEDVVECVKRDIDQAGPGRHLVVSTAGSINPGTSFDNLKAMLYAVEKYGYIY